MYLNNTELRIDFSILYYLSWYVFYLLFKEKKLQNVNEKIYNQLAAEGLLFAKIRSVPTALRTKESQIQGFQIV